MPTYLFRCPKCKAVREKESSAKEGSNPIECPDCKVEMNRVYTAPNISFKGRGFYSTDYS